MEKNKKAKKILTCVIAGLAIALAVSFYLIYDLHNEIDKLNSSYENSIAMMRDNIDSIYGNVDSKLKKQASLFSKIDYSYGELNKETKQVPLNLTVVPKNITDDMKVSVNVEGETVEFARAGDEFKAAVNVGLFHDFDEYPLFKIVTGDITKTEYSENVNISNLFSSYLPVLSLVSSDFNRAGGVLNMNLSFSFTKDPKSPVMFESAAIIKTVNGKEIGREDVSEYKDKDMVSTSTHISVPYKKGDTVEVFIEAVDSLGFVHRVAAVTYSDNYAKEPEEYTVMPGVEYIYDGEGKLLYGKTGA